MLSPKHSITATINGYVIDIRYVGEPETRTVHCATDSVWPGPLLIVLYLVFKGKSSDSPDLK